MKKIQLMAVAVAAVGVLALSGCGYNKTIALEETVKSQWAQVDNQLKRRYDLIPNLVETVKGYATHEMELFTKIAEVRKSYFSATDQGEKIKASNQMEGLLSRLLVLKETYPTLKANEGFLKLQDQLEGTENRIAVERKRYNDAVRELNTYIRGIPGVWWASLTGVKAATYFEIPEAEKAAPKVKF
ncbi:MAG: LemA family protein [Myxococcota bacterium]|jgi:LemA protein